MSINLTKKVLVFHMNPFRTASFFPICREIGCTLTAIDARFCAFPVGALAMAVGEDGVFDESKLPTVAGTLKNDSGEKHSEMMLFCGLTSEDIDRFLAAQKRNGIQTVDFKAVLTGTNAAWSADKLYQMIREEHHKMHG